MRWFGGFERFWGEGGGLKRFLGRGGGWKALQVFKEVIILVVKPFFVELERGGDGGWLSFNVPKVDVV